MAHTAREIDAESETRRDEMDLSPALSPVCLGSQTKGIGGIHNIPQHSDYFSPSIHLSLTAKAHRG